MPSTPYDPNPKSRRRRESKFLSLKDPNCYQVKKELCKVVKEKVSLILSEQLYSVCHSRGTFSESYWG